MSCTTHVLPQPAQSPLFWHRICHAFSAIIAAATVLSFTNPGSPVYEHVPHPAAMCVSEAWAERHHRTIENLYERPCREWRGVCCASG